MIIEGRVVQGKQLGRTIGFPTANIEAECRLGDGPDGVYAAWIDVEGVRCGAMVNIGHHPTLPEGGRTVEAHIFDFCGDVYGMQVRLETVAYLRPERKFGSVDELRNQLEKDKITARTILGSQISTPPGIE